MKKFLLALAASAVFFGASAQTVIPKPAPVAMPGQALQSQKWTVDRDIVKEQSARRARGYTAENYVSFVGALEGTLGSEFQRFAIPLFKDSTAVNVGIDASNNLVSNWNTWIQMGACFDPSEDIIWDTFAISRYNRYTVDSIGFYRNYIRQRDSFFNTVSGMMEEVVDTMIIQWGIVSAANQFTWQNEAMEVFGSLGLNRNTGLAVVPVSQIVKIPLTAADTSGRTNYQFFSYGLPNRLSVPADGIMAAVIGYRSGVPNNFGDTLSYPLEGEFALVPPPVNRYNLFRIRTAVEPTNYALTSRNNGLLLDKQQAVRDRGPQGFGSRYLPSSYFLTRQYPEIAFHFTAFNKSLEEKDLKNGYGSELFPNPTQGVANIAFALPKAEQVTIQVLDLTGKVVMNVDNNMYPAGKNQVRFETSALKAGMYLYSITAGGFVQTAKFIVAQ